MDRAWWTKIPRNHPVYLSGVSAERLAIALDPLPDGAPAVVRLTPAAVRSFSHGVSWLLGELDRAAVALFLQWLPDADQLDQLSPTSLAAVRALAAKLAAGSPHFGPFLVELAVRAFRVNRGDVGVRPANQLGAEVRAAGLVRILAAAYRREYLVLFADMPGDLTPLEQRALAGAVGWICNHSGASVWLVGAKLAAVDSIPSLTIVLPDSVPWAADDSIVTMAEAAATFPAISGLPRADSPAEQALEQALKRHEWALARRWNHTLELKAIAEPYRVDLLWEMERLVVEVDGDDHRGRVKYADDRIRDVRLALHGYQVVRFTNEHIISDVATVVDQVKRLLFNRRKERTHIERHDDVQG